MTQLGLRSDDVLPRLVELIVQHGPLEHTRSEDGPEFTAKGPKDWLARVGARTLFIALGSPRGNGYKESFSGNTRGELIIEADFCDYKEARVLIDW